MKSLDKFTVDEIGLNILRQLEQCGLQEDVKDPGPAPEKPEMPEPDTTVYVADMLGYLGDDLAFPDKETVNRLIEVLAGKTVYGKIHRDEPEQDVFPKGVSTIRAELIHSQKQLKAMEQARGLYLSKLHKWEQAKSKYRRFVALKRGFQRSIQELKQKQFRSRLIATVGEEVTSAGEGINADSLVNKLLMQLKRGGYLKDDLEGLFVNID